MEDGVSNLGFEILILIQYFIYMYNRHVYFLMPIVLQSTFQR